MTATSRFALPQIAPGQAQKEAFHNEALAGLDAATPPCVEGGLLVTPPSDPQLGQGWLVAAGATGDRAGADDSLACWSAGGWRFTASVPGMTAWDAVAGHWVYWSGSAWIGVPGRLRR